MNKTLDILIPISLVALLCASAFAAPPPNEVLGKLKSAAGYEVKLFMDKIPDARSLALGAQGTVFVSNRTGGSVYAIKDGQKYEIAKNMHVPNGIAFHEGTLYVAEVSKIYKLEDIEAKLANPPKPKLVTAQFPTDGHHGWKFIAVGPDKKLYVPVGAPCNNCDRREKDERYAAILRTNLDGSGTEVYARGVRNTVGFDWRPSTKELWFTDNGRDMMGDDKPPCELNFAPRAGMDFGYPYCHGKDVLDPDFGAPANKKCADYTPPKVEIPAHSAPLGMRFIDDDTILMAEHGSWNRSKKIGYRVTRVKLKPGSNEVLSYEPFLEGFLQPGEEVLGRPVDVLALQDGSVLISDDYGDRVYQMVPTKQNRKAAGKGAEKNSTLPRKK